MVLAGHHVISDLIVVVESNDVEKVKDICEKFCGRYPQDEELLNIICEGSSPASEFIAAGDEASREKLKSELQRLWNIRQLESSGGEKLWYKDRRP
ncbi:MAG: hypothetical protein JW778_02390 [Candidatus Altiarchaeota archaeon]|nr:hypothetical protein [Candidatus Altiarchaeota archaeon]